MAERADSRRWASLGTRIEHYGDVRHRRRHVLEYLQPLAADVGIEVGKSGQVAGGMGNIRDEALTNRISIPQRTRSE